MLLTSLKHLKLNLKTKKALHSYTDSAPANSGLRCSTLNVLTCRFTRGSELRIGESEAAD